jgi:hypothetical protein
MSANFGLREPISRTPIATIIFGDTRCKSPFYPQNTFITPSAAGFALLKSAGERKIWEFKTLFASIPWKSRLFKVSHRWKKMRRITA